MFFCYIGILNIIWIHSFIVHFTFGHGAVIHSETGLEMPLISDDDVPLVAKFDTSKINKAIKEYINRTTEIAIQEKIRDMKKAILGDILSNKYPRDCEDIEVKESGVYRIYPSDPRGFDAFCDMVQDGGGWTVFQRRMDGSVDFYRNWNDYKNGFGNIEGEFWLGNTKIHDITSRDEYELLITLEDFDNEKRFARYKTFGIDDGLSLYKITVSGYNGTAGDNMAYHNGKRFSAKDNTPNNCVARFKGGWWYFNCHEANLNGLYLNGTHTTFADGINWIAWKGYQYSLKRTEMMVRRRR